MYLSGGTPPEALELGGAGGNLASFSNPSYDD